MKAERRHELSQNELAKVIKGAPTFWQQSGGKLLLGLIVVLLIVILVQYRIRSNREALAQATEQLALGRAAIEQLDADANQMMWMFGPPHEVVLRRKSALSEGNNAIENAVRISDQRNIQAEAMLARGDLNYRAAMLPDVPGAATQPSLQLKPEKEYLATAQEAYQTVVNSYGDVTHAAAAAKFGLGAIHEDRGEWDAAKTVYDEIAKQPNQVGAYKALAESKVAMIPMLRTPVILGKPATEPAMPELTSTTSPSTRPLPPTIAAPTTAAAATNPAVATTAPTTAATRP